MLTESLPEDLALAILEPRHAEPLFKVVDQNRSYLRKWLPWLDTTRSARDTLDFIESSQKQVADNNGRQTALLFRGEIVGMIGHIRIDWQNRSTSLGYWLAEQLQGRGLMTAACEAYITHAFRQLDLNRVEIRAAVGNSRSRAIPERLGFTLEGVIRQAEWLYDHFEDHVLYGLLKSEWLSAGTAGMLNPAARMRDFPGPAAS